MAEYSIAVRLKLPFKRAMEEAEKALQAEGFVVITRIDLQAELARQLQQHIPPYTILGVWVPSWEAEALHREPDIGLLMPTHLCLWENDADTCTLATADLKHLCHAGQDTPVAQAARAVNARLRAVLASVQFAGVGSAPKAVPTEHISRGATLSG
jgi:uncharacterized protein (DUF302 family)